ncbi:MAG TPA: hypothetical protein VNT75_08230 [Symbiobacteriaceae bacterium]|nr:hypothetical protein [Symbiobacteriaceae bacterium]
MEEQRQSPWLWVGIGLIALAALAWGILFVLAHPDLTPYLLGRLVGVYFAMFVRSGALIGVLTFILLGVTKRPQRQLVALGLFLLGAALVVEGGYKGATELRTVRDQQRAMADVKTLMTPVLTQSGTATRAASDVKDTALNRWILSWVERNQALAADQQKLYEQNGLATILSPQSMADAPTVLAGIERCRSVERGIGELESRLRALYDGAPGEIRALDISPEMRSGILKGFQKASDTARKQTEDFYALERRAVVDIRLVLEYMYKIRDKYQVQENRILFATDVELNEYNRLIGVIQANAKEEAQMRATVQQRMKEAADELAKLN